MVLYRGMNPPDAGDENYYADNAAKLN